MTGRPMVPSKRSVTFVLLSVALAGCATTGRVADNTFVDARYHVAIRFPAAYAVKPVADRDSRYRVTAVSRRMPDNRRPQAIAPCYGLYIAPKSALQRRANTNEELFRDFVSLESDNYCVRLHRIVARPQGERTVNLPNGKTALIRHFNSSVLLPHSVTAYGDGMAAFLDQGEFFMKLEYLADSATVDRDEFITVLRSINIK